MRSRVPKVAIIPGEIAGYGANLADGFRQQGIDVSCCFVIPYAYGGDAEANEVPPACRFAQSIVRFSNSLNGRWRLIRWPLKLVTAILRLSILTHIIVFRNEIISLCGTPLLHSWEWLLARAFGCRVTVVYLGSDARPHYLGGNIVGRNQFADPLVIREKTRKQKKRIGVVERRVDRVVSCDVIGHFLTRPYWDFFQIGFPRKIIVQEFSLSPSSPDTSAEVVIVHAPSNPEAKGTKQWRKVIEELKLEGIPIKWIELIGVPNSVVLSHIKECDIVVDELWADTPLGGLATEAWIFGKPAVVGGYAQNELQHMARLGAPLECYIKPEHIKSTIRNLCLDPELRKQQGQAGRSFTAGYYSAHNVAGRYLKLFNDQPMREWQREPYKITYVHGIAFPEPVLCVWLKKYLQATGEEGLFLEDKSELRKCLKIFAEGSDVIHAYGAEAQVAL